MSETQVPTLHEVGQMIQDNGLEGEEKTRLSVTTGMIRGGAIVLTGLSSTGKTELVEAASGVFSDSEVMEIPSSTSPKALFNRADELNAARVHIYPDLESLDEHIERMLKRHGEEKNCTHEYLDVEGQRSNEAQVLTPPDTIVICIASDNQNLDLNDYPELRNRALVISTDGSEEQTEKVLDRQALEEMGEYEDNLSPERKRAIQRHMGSIPVDRYGRDDSMGEMRNPPAGALRDNDPLPTNFPEVRRDFPRLMDFIRSVALYHAPNRLTTVDKDGVPVLLVAPKDAWIAMKVFGEDMIMSALNLQDIDKTIIEVMREDPAEGWTANEMQMRLREEGHNITDRDVRSSFKNMKEKGYVRQEKNTNGVNEYFTSPFASALDHQAAVDWESVIEDSKRSVRNTLPEESAEEYISRFCEGDGLLATHPITGKVYDITEDDELAEKAQEAQEAVSEAMSGSVYDTAEEDTQEGGDDQEPSGGLYEFESVEEDDEIEAGGESDDEADTSGVLQ